MRQAVLDDAKEIAAIHVASWRETYPSLLPASEIRRHDIASRSALWRAVITSGRCRIAVIPQVGFAAMGPQRDATLTGSHPEDLLALYVLKSHHGQGHGCALLSAVRGSAAFTAWVLSGNQRAEVFYARFGATELRREREVIDGVTVTDILLGFASRPDPA